MSKPCVDLSAYKERRSISLRMARILWCLVNCTIFRVLGTVWLRLARIAILKLFGAKIPWCSLVYPSCKIWAPWNLSVGKYSCIGPRTEIYNKAQVSIGNNAIISQGSFICTASHDISHSCHRLITAPIAIGDYAWVAADAFIGMGVSLGEGAVVGARSAVFKDVSAWTVVGGNPAQYLKDRVISS